MSALTDKLKKQARALIPRFYREYKGASDWWHSVKIDGKYYDLNFLTHDPDGTGEFPVKLRDSVKVVAYKVIEDEDGLHQSDRGLMRLGYFKGKKVRRKFDDMDVEDNPPAPAGYHYMPDGKLMADSAHSVSKNPFSRESDRIKGYDDDRDEIPDKPLFKSGGYAVVITFKSGEVKIGQGMSQSQAEGQRKYLMKEYARLKLTRGYNNLSSIEVLPVTSVAKNPPLSSHGSSFKIKRTHGLSLPEMRALYKLVKQGNDMAIAYARKKLEVPRSESKVQLLAVVDHHIRDLAGR